MKILNIQINIYISKINNDANKYINKLIIKKSVLSQI